MIALLRANRGAVHILYPADAEARVFALRLAAILNEAGWETTTEGALSFGPVTAFTVKVRDDTNPPARAAVLRQAVTLGIGEEVFPRRQGDE